MSKMLLDIKVCEVIRSMSTILNADQLRQLKSVMYIVFSTCTLQQDESSDIMIISDGWKYDVQDFLMSKSLEGLSQDTIERYKYELERLLCTINKNTKDITNSDISKYITVYKHIRGVKNSTLRNVRAIFSSFFAWCRDTDRIQQNPMVRVEKIKVEKVIRKPFTDEEREKLFRCTKNLRDKAILEFLYSTAIRVSELCKLNIDDINWSCKDLIVYGKGGKERKVYLNDRANMYLKEYLESRTDNDPALFVSLKSPIIAYQMMEYGI